MKIAVLDDYQDVVRSLDSFAVLAEHEVTVFTGPLGPRTRLDEFEALVLIRERTPVTRGLLDRMPRLRAIAQTGRAGAHIDLAACEARGISILEGSGSPVAPAELTWGLILAASRRIPQYAEALRFGDWQRNGLEGTPGALGGVLSGRTLGIWGYGRIGSLVAGYGAAFGMRVLAWGREASLAAARADGRDLATGAGELFEESDVLSLHLRLTDETRGIVTAGHLGRMRAGALFVNTSRAALVEGGALLEALRRGRPGFAALDVFDVEPLPSVEPLLQLPNVVCTPHIGYVERESYESYFGGAFAALLAFESGSRA